jgi:hypothetical protein
MLKSDEQWALEIRDQLHKLQDIVRGAEAAGLCVTFEDKDLEDVQWAEITRRVPVPQPKKEKTP